MTKTAEQEAEVSLIAQYESKFRETPDAIARLMCKTMAKRLVAGENIVWQQVGENWRTLGVPTTTSDGNDIT